MCRWTRKLRSLGGWLVALTALLIAVIAAPTGAVTARAATATPAGPAHPAMAAVAPNSRGVTIVAGVHDTAINDCDGSGTATSPNLAAAAESLNNPSFPAGVTTVRVTMPWDIADPGIVASTPQVANPAADEAELNVTGQCLNAWLHAAFAHGKQPEIDFRADTMFAEAPTGGNAKGQVLMPSLANYEAAMNAFSSSYVACGANCADGGAVKVVAAWNEPDNEGFKNGAPDVGSTYNLLLYPYNTGTHLAGTSCPASPTVTNCGAAMAANLWLYDYQAFAENKGGTVPAGDFSAGDGLLTVKGGACPNTCPYLFLYNKIIAAAGLAPGHWAIHPYTDIENYQDGTTGTTRLATFAAKLQKYGYTKSTFIWLNEVSACDNNSASECGSDATYVHGKVDAINYLVSQLPLTVSTAGPQVGRIDYYCFNGGEAQCDNDWALENSPATSTSLNAAGLAYQTWAKG